MHPDTRKYNAVQAPIDREICDLLALEIDRNLSEADNKMWHAHPVWFLDGNPIAGYSKLKNCVRLLFWSWCVSTVAFRRTASSRELPCERWGIVRDLEEPGPTGCGWTNRRCRRRRQA